jgi:hypothetical protein
MEDKQFTISDRLTSTDYKDIMRYFYSIFNSSSFTVEKRINDLYHTKSTSIRSKVNKSDEDIEEKDDSEYDGDSVINLGDTNELRETLYDINDTYLYTNILNTISLSTSESIKKSYLYYIVSHPKYRVKFNSLELDETTELPEINKINKDINSKFLPSLFDHFKDNKDEIKNRLVAAAKEYVKEEDQDGFVNRIMTDMNSTKIDFTGAYRKYSSNKKYGDRLLIDSSCIAQLRNEMNILKKKYVNKSTTLNIRDDVEQFLNQTYREYLNNINFIEEKSNLKGILNDIENY